MILFEDLMVMNDVQKKNSVDWYRKMLDNLHQSASNLIHTDDELWVFEYEPEREGQSTVWIFQGEEKPTIVIRYWRIMMQTVATVTLEHHKDRGE